MKYPDDEDETKGSGDPGWADGRRDIITLVNASDNKMPQSKRNRPG